MVRDLWSEICGQTGLELCLKWLTGQALSEVLALRIAATT